MMATLRVPNEFRYVQALTAAVGPQHSLGFLLSVGAIQEGDLEVGSRLYETLRSLTEARAGQLGELERPARQLAEGLAPPGGRAFVAWWVGRMGNGQEGLVDGLARVGAAQGNGKRPWNQLNLSDFLMWRRWVVGLLALAAVEEIGKLAADVRAPAPLVII